MYCCGKNKMISAKWYSQLMQKLRWLLVKYFTMTGGHLDKGNIGDYTGRSNCQFLNLKIKQLVDSAVLRLFKL